MGQLQFGTIKLNGKLLQNIPRYSWNLPFYHDYVSLDKKEKVRIINGVLLKNGGVIFNRDGDRFKYRNISIGTDLGFLFTIKEKFILFMTGGVDYNFHYKEKVFRDEKRSKKEVLLTEWSSNRVNRFVPFVKVGFGFKDSYYIYFEYFLKGMMNTSYIESVNGVNIRLYEGLEITRFNIGFSTNLLSNYNIDKN